MVSKSTVREVDKRHKNTTLQNHLSLGWFYITKHQTETVHWHQPLLADETLVSSVHLVWFGLDAAHLYSHKSIYLLFHPLSFV